MENILSDYPVTIDCASGDKARLPEDVRVRIQALEGERLAGT